MKIEVVVIVLLLSRCEYQCVCIVRVYKTEEMCMTWHICMLFSVLLQIANWTNGNGTVRYCCNNNHCPLLILQTDDQTYLS
jgi:hypothetical protein